MDSASSSRRPDVAGERTAPFVAAMKHDFPRFEILYKRTSKLHRAIHVALAIVTFGGMRTYLSHYHTVLFGKLWVPDKWDEMSDEDRYILLRHERVHCEQRRRMGDLVMAFVYLVPFFPIGLAYGRARIEWEAYVETIRATCEVYGLERAKRLEPELVRRFTGADYGWMWPFPGTIRRWFEKTIRTFERRDEIDRR
jgi:hypothetical protein